MSTIKEYKQFFLRGTAKSSPPNEDQESGYPTTYVDADGNVVGNRFLPTHKPSNSVFSKLFYSIPFILNSEDTSSESQQGLAKTATDDNAYDKSNADADNMAVHVKPSQLPYVTTADADNISVTKSKQVDGGGNESARYEIGLGADMAALLSNKKYLYIGYADDASGTGFSLDTANIAKPYWAFLIKTEAVTPLVAEFSGLWRRFEDQDTTESNWAFTYGTAAASGGSDDDIYLKTDSNELYKKISTVWTLIYTFPSGGSGTSSYAYVGYADDNIGTNFSTVPSTSRKYIAFKTSSTPLTPVVGDFTGLWQKYQGDDGGDGSDALAPVQYAADVVVGDISPSIITLVTVATLQGAGMTLDNVDQFKALKVEIYDSNHLDMKTRATDPVTDISFDYAGDGFIGAKFGATETVRLVITQIQ